MYVVIYNGCAPTGPRAGGLPGPRRAPLSRSDGAVAKNAKASYHVYRRKVKHIVTNV